MKAKKTGAEAACEIVGGVIGTIFIIFAAFIAAIFGLAKKS